MNVKMRSIEERLAEKSRKIKAVESQRDYFKKKCEEVKENADTVNVYIILFLSIHAS